MRPDLTIATIWSALGDPVSDPIVRRALLELVLIGVSAGALGCWVVLYGFSYGAESLSHSLLPGLVLATLAGGSIVVGGLAGALVAALAIAAARQVPTVGGDTAIAVVVTTMFGAGVLLALSPASPPGLASLLFGDVLGTTNGDLALAAISALVVTGVLYGLHGRLLATGFDRDGARAIGVRPGAIETAVLVLTALVMVVAVQGLGNLLVLAVLIGPAMVARRLTRRIGTMLVAAVGVAAIGGAAGIYASYYLGSAAGASVAASFVVLYLLAGLAAPLAARR
jgi:ABC-type Mn2+/Zn2+ transport system permease subunit